MCQVQRTLSKRLEIRLLLCNSQTCRSISLLIHRIKQNENVGIISGYYRTGSLQSKALVTTVLTGWLWAVWGNWQICSGHVGNINVIDRLVNQ